MGNVFIGSVKRELYWIIGSNNAKNYPFNLRITKNRPTGKLVREPFDSYNDAERYRRSMITEFYFR